MLRLGCKRFLRFSSQRNQTQPQTLLRLYHDRVADHCNNPHNIGSLDKDDPAVRMRLVGAPACGDKLGRLLMLECAFIYFDYITKWVMAKQREEVQFRHRFFFPSLTSPMKLHCSMLAEDAIKAAVKAKELSWGQMLRLQQLRR
uniref:NIF system FeS cluster assembly NifU N-terminal domain-containing protein n=1 Tax=Nelumbo nucifera TaxID=4432 RepID=A0A822XM50_NELNU|nr:TPA_asm: hypothetical protein HUJ06_022246 [Nelumbo nucifera]